MSDSSSSESASASRSDGASVAARVAALRHANLAELSARAAPSEPQQSGEAEQLRSGKVTIERDGEDSLVHYATGQVAL